MKKTLLTIAAIAALSACCNCTTENALAGKWNIESAMGTSTEGAENQAFIEFSENGSLSGNASVNIFNGSYKLDGENLTLENIGMTKMMGASMEIEDAVTAALNATATVSINGEQAFVLNETKDTVMVLSLVKE